MKYFYKNISFEILDNNEYDNINELFSFGKYKKDNKIYLPIPKNLKIKMLDINKDVENYLRNNSPITGYSTENKPVTFFLDVTYHFITKYYRVEMEDPDHKRGMINPNKYECFHIFEKNVNKLANIIIENLSKPQILVKVRDLSGLEFIFAVRKMWKNKKDKKNKYKVEIKFLTQIKGKVRLSNQEKKNTQIIKLHREGDKNMKYIKKYDLDFNDWDTYEYVDNYFISKFVKTSYKDQNNKTFLTSENDHSIVIKMKIEYWDKFLHLLDNGVLVNKLNMLKNTLNQFLTKNKSDIFFIYLTKYDNNKLKIYIKRELYKKYKYIYNIEQNKVISII